MNKPNLQRLASNTHRELLHSTSKHPASLVQSMLGMATKLEHSLQPRLRQRGSRWVLPACLMRAGTSKGLFLDRRDLPVLQEDWVPWILAAMGSKNNDPRQIDGVGGATSTTSKVAIIEQSKRPGVDVDFTFAQVAVGRNTVDFSGTCGNISSGVGPYAVEQGLVRTTPGQKEVEVRIFNTNTQKYLLETVALDDDGLYEEEGDFRIAGVMGTGSELKLAFVDPAGSVTGKLFPTGHREQTLKVHLPRNEVEPFQVSTTLIDAANPFVLVDSTSLPVAARGLDQKASRYIDLIEDIRREGAVLMGLADTIEEAATTRGTPKIAVLSTPSMLLGRQDKDPSPDIFVEAMSMGMPHPSLQLTGAVCLGSAVCLPGTIAHRLAGAKGSSAIWPLTPEGSASPASSASDDESAESDISTSMSARPHEEKSDWSLRRVVLAHSSGSIQVDVKVRPTLTAHIESCSVSRTARMLFAGNVLFHA